MAQESEVSVQFFASGYCESHAFVVNPKEGKGKTKFYAVWALLHFPKVGYVLFDTGYSNHFEEASRTFPERFYRWATPVTLSEENTAKSILLRMNIPPESIKYLIISHFHADHISGIRDFPNARFICTRDAFLQVKELRGIRAVSKGILHKLLPNNIDDRISMIEDLADTMGTNESGQKTYSIFGADNFCLVLLPGHARGMLGFVLNQNKQTIYYGTDASWDYDCYKKGILPHWLANLIFDSRKDYEQTLLLIKDWESKGENRQVIFTHCPKTLAYLNHAV